MCLKSLSKLFSRRGLHTVVMMCCVLPQTAWAGDAKADFALAQQYEHGEGVTQNAALAVSWYCRAARQGLLEAQQGLGWMYMKGHGVKKNDAIARRWFQKAAKQGDVHAQRMLRFLDPDAYRDERICMPQITHFWRRYCQKKACQKVLNAVRVLAPEYALDPNLVLSIILQESRFNPKAKSPKNAQGLMQLMPGTARRFKVKHVWKIEDNLRGGMAYLRWLLAYYQGDVRLVAAAYNAGEGAVERYQGVPRYRETQRYVIEILRLYGKKTHAFQADWIPASSLLAN